MTFLKNNRIILLTLIVLGCFILNQYSRTSLGGIHYVRNFFLPYQQFRNRIFNLIPFSIGDVIYLILLLLIFYWVIKGIIMVFHKKYTKKDFVENFSIGITVFCVMYFVFFFSWGANYNKESILPEEVAKKIEWNDDYLKQMLGATITDLNHYQKGTIREEKLDNIRTQLKQTYQSYLGEQTPDVYAKRSLFSGAVAYMGIQGYYNPFTGEAMISEKIPNFMWGFVTAHEMAHQLGVAVEGEANFLAYVICMQSQDSTIHYSGKLNLFLYAYRELFDKDSTVANQYFNQLNTYNKDNILELRRMRKLYKGRINEISNEWYNKFLKNQGQDKGLESYREISKWVYNWERFGEIKPNVY